MAELVISADEVEAALARHVADYTPSVIAEQVGRVVEVGRRDRPGVGTSRGVRQRAPRIRRRHHRAWRSTSTRTRSAR